MTYAVQRVGETMHEVTATSAADTPLVTRAEEDAIDSLVQEMKHLYDGAGVRLALQLGQLIIEQIFHGDLGRWKSRGRKDVSFRKLARHPELPFRASTLSRAVGIYMLWKRRSDLLEFEHVGSSHLHEVAGLSAEAQDRLIERAEAERWSVKRLRQEVLSLAMRRGKKRELPQFARYVRALAPGVAQTTLLADIDRMDGVGPEDVRALLDVVRDLIRQAEVLEQKLCERLEAIDEAGCEPRVLAPGEASEDK